MGTHRRRLSLLHWPWLGLLLVVGPLLTPGWAAGDPAVKKRPGYTRDIRPLLAAYCYACHGPDSAKREANLRLDRRESAVKEAIVPGRAAESPLVLRITSKDPNEQMPPPESKRPPLPPDAVARIRQWIDDGAQYEPHWSYVRPVRPPVPEVRRTDWPRNPIDRFIAAAHEEHALHPSPDAEPRTLVRRLRFDLTGLPPTPEEADAFAADPGPAAYERTVDRLLASPQFGERMAAYWLDVARYADSCGYHSDNEREIWMYRDYVVAAFNANKPLDRFIIEQLAGDLLPGATDQQRIASGYNRLLQTTEEGGAQAKEYTAKYASDRVRNTATAWLGSTMGCAQCHDHKFDPFTTKDFYSFAAFFADVREVSPGRQEQTPMPSAEQAERMKWIDEEILRLEKAGVKDVAKNKTSSKQPSPPAPLPVGEGSKTGQTTLAQQLADLKKQKDALQKSIPTTLITVAVPPRVVRVQPRGNWQDDSGEIVQPAVPAFLGIVPVQGRRANRLDLAQWLAARDNPLVARVFVNRLWMLLFGQGLVRTTEDFGTQGALPSHPELLDWLATELIQSGWNVKHTMKLLVMSRTYRQSSRGSAELESEDPGNVWLARQGRFRLDAEMVRDNALAASGLLSPRMGGPPVKPYQPAGYWSFLNFPKRQWADDHGENQYRRGMYTFWQRTFLHPSLLAFDASTREECTPQRTRSNTTLQALALLDDPTYVEAARVLAARAVREGGRTEPQRTRYVFRRLLAREPTAAEAELLVRLYRRHLAAYQADEPAARALLKVGDTPPPEGVAVADLAAWTSVARALLNLHETITRD